MQSLNQKLKQLETEINTLNNKVSMLAEELTKTTYPNAISINKGETFKGEFVSDLNTGFGGTFKNKIIWNDVELTIPINPEDISNITPTKGYHRHSHSRYAGGALDINTLELVEYERDGEGKIAGNLPEHSQSFWVEDPPIVKMDRYDNSQFTPHSLGGEIAQNVTSQVEKIGKVSWIFNPILSKWGVSAYEIDIKNCFLVEYDKDGNIEKDENNVEKKAPLWNSDSTKTSIIWDKNSQCWRLYAVYAEIPE